MNKPNPPARTSGCERKILMLNGIIFLIFYAYLLLQFSKVFIYYDDFGYLSLSYGGAIPDVAGSDYSFPQMVSFVGRHFFLSNGRLPFVFVFLFVHMLGGLWAVQAFLATAVLLISVFSFRIVMRCTGLTGWRQCPAAVFVCLLYGTIGIMIHRSGTYWFSASFLYVVPTVVFLAFTVFYIRLADAQLAFFSGEETAKPRIRRLFAAVLLLAYFTAFSHEQWTAAAIGCIFMVTGYKLKKGGKIQITDVCIILAVIAGALPIFLSPAVRERMSRNQAYMEMNLIEKILNNMKNIGNLFFSGENINYLLILLLSLACLGLYLFRTHRKLFRLHALFILFTGAVLCYVIVKLKLHRLGPEAHSTFMLVCLYLYLLAAACEIMLLFSLKKQFLPATLFLAGIFSMGCLVLTPELPQRTLLPFIFLSYTVLTYLFVTVALQWKAAGILGLLILAALSVPNMQQIYHGYAANYAVHMYNDARIREASAEIKKGTAVSAFPLYQNADRLCCCEMVYDPNFDYMIYWMREYYDLPENTALNYQALTGDAFSAILDGNMPPYTENMPPAVSPAY